MRSCDLYPTSFPSNELTHSPTHTRAHHPKQRSVREVLVMGTVDELVSLQVESVFSNFEAVSVRKRLTATANGLWKVCLWWFSCLPLFFCPLVLDRD